MGWPWGLSKPADGPGTTALDMQRILGARWGSAGVIAGCVLSGTAGMKWQLSGGAVVVSSGAGLAVEVPVDAQQVAQPAAPASGTRRDWVVVSSLGQVSIVSVEPTSGTIIASVQVPAGVTATTQIGVELARRQALPVGASLGTIAEWVDPAPEGQDANTTEEVMWEATLPILPTKREIEIEIRQCLAYFGDQAARGGYQHKLRLDGASLGSVAMDVSFTWASRTATLRTALPYSTAPHIIRYSKLLDWGTVPKHFGATAALRAGVRVRDLGVVA